MHNIEDLKKDKFYNSLSLADKDRYLGVLRDFNEKCIERGYAEIEYHDFLEEKKNYDDLPHEYDRVNYEWVECMEKQNEFLRTVHLGVEMELNGMIGKGYDKWMKENA